MIVANRERPPRLYKKCTGCSEDLPRNRPNWGLVWDSGEHGMCKKCLYQIRSAIGFYDKNPEQEKIDKPKGE